MDKLQFIVALIGVGGVCMLAAAALARRPDFSLRVSVGLATGTFAAYTLPPAFCAAWLGEYSVLNFGFPIHDWTLGLVLEASLMAVTLAVVIRAAGHRFWIAEHIQQLLRTRTDEWTLLLVLYGVCKTLEIALSGPWAAWRYEAVVYDPMHGEVNYAIGTYFFVLHNLSIPILLVLMFARLDRPATQITRAARVVMGIVFLAPYALMSVVHGGRGFILQLAIMLFLVLAYNQVRGGGRRRFPTLGLCVLAATLAFLTVASPAFVAFRLAAAEMPQMTDLDRLATLSSYVTQAPGEGQDIETTLSRLDTAQDAGILAQFARDSGQYAGFQPFLGAFLSWLPRYLWPEKPLATSIDDSLSGTPPYITGALRGIWGGTASTGASGIAFWQMGWLGVLITAIGNAMVILLIVRPCLRAGVFGLAVFLIMARQTYFSMVNPLDVWIMIILKSLLPLLVLAALYRVALARPFAARRARASCPVNSQGRLSTSS